MRFFSEYSYPGRLLGFSVIMMLCTLLVVDAQESIQYELTRDAAIELALTQNHNLKIESLAVDRAESSLRWAGRLSNPELEVSGSFDDFGQDEGEYGFGIGLRYDLPVTPRRSKEKIVRDLNQQLVRQQYRARQRDLAYEVERVWIQLWAASQAVEVETRLHNLNQEIVAFMNDQAKLGEVSYLDSVQASLSGRLLEQQVGQSRQQVDITRHRLKQLLGVAPATNIRFIHALSLPETFSPEAIQIRSVIDQHPDVAVAKLATRRSHAGYNLAKAERWEDVGLKAFVERERANDEPAGLENETMVGLEIAIPLPFHNRNQEALEQRSIDLKDAEQTFEARCFAVDHAVAAAMTRQAQAYSLAAAARGEVSKLAEKSLADLKVAYESGQASLIQVQRAQAQLLELETSALELETEFHLAAAKVRFLLGTYPISKYRTESP